MKSRRIWQVAGLLILCGVGLASEVHGGERAVLALSNQLDDGNEWQRMMAATALGELGPKAAPTVPALIRTLKSRKPLTRPYTGGSWTFGNQAPGEARKALVSIGAVAVPALKRALVGGDALTRVNAAWALWELDDNDEQVIPVLVAAWKDKLIFELDECVRNDASAALGAIGRKHPEKILPLLLEAMKEKDEEIVFAAEKSLGIMGTNVKEAVVVLIAALREKREGVSNAAGWMLREIGSPSIPLLVAALTDADPELRSRAAWTLGGMKWNEARGAEPALKRATEDADAEVRKWANWALEQLAKARE